MIREVTSKGEGVRSLQNQKQALIDAFKKEYQRFRKGQISEKALSTSSQRVSKELAALDARIRSDVRNAMSTAKRAQSYIGVYLPERIHASTRGVTRIAKRKSSSKARKAVKKTVKKTARKAARKTARKSTKARKAARRPSKAKARRVKKR